MHVIYDDNEMSDFWNDVEFLTYDTLRPRDVRNLSTMADAECYWQYTVAAPEMRGFWENMTHHIVEVPSKDSKHFALNASNEYFEERHVVVMRLTDDGRMQMTFGGWMDARILGTYQSIVREWIKKVCERDSIWANVDTEEVK